MSYPRDKKIESSKLCDKLSHSAAQVVTYLKSQLKTDGSYGDKVTDIACYFKAPMMFLTAGDSQSALAILNYIKSAFMCRDGDFKTSEILKSANSAYIEYWSYTNGWILRAANLLGLKDITEPGLKYFTTYNLGKKTGFSTNQVTQEPQVTDVLTVAHHGLLNLEMENLDVAIAAGHFLCEAFKKQPDLSKGFYLRSDKEGNVITQFPDDKLAFYFVNATEPNQLHFMIGYPAAYLAMLYKKTKNQKFLDAAKSYLEFSLSCDKSVYACNFSHKIAWAASLIYECTGHERYLAVIDSISDYFIERQENGMWFIEDVNASFDQGAEIACWFLDIVKNINNFKKKAELIEAKTLEMRQHKPWTAQAIKLGAIALVAGAGLYALLRPKTSATVICGTVAEGVVRKLNGV